MAYWRENERLGFKCLIICHFWGFSDDCAIVGREWTILPLGAKVNSPPAQCVKNQGVGSGPEVDQCASHPSYSNIQGVSVDMVEVYQYLGMYLDKKLDWSKHVEIVYRKGQSRR